MGMKYFLFPFFYLLFCSSIECRSDNIETVISFGDNLFLKKKYFSALNEYQRAFFFSKGELKCQLGKKIADCYLILEDYKMARTFYDSASFYSKYDSLKTSCEFQKILCFMKQNDFGYALLKLNNLKVDADIHLMRRKNLYQGICFFGTGRYDASYQHFLNSIAQIDTNRRLQLQLIFENQKMLKRPNSSAAIMLSLLIPGAGQVYSGDFKDGLNSLLLLGSLFYLGSAGSLNNLMAIVPFFYRYYMGGILKAKQIAERKRKEKQYIFYSNLMEVLLK
jgi:hypothetical protein